MPSFVHWNSLQFFFTNRFESSFHSFFTLKKSLLVLINIGIQFVCFCVHFAFPKCFEQCSHVIAFYVIYLVKILGRNGRIGKLGATIEKNICDQNVSLVAIFPLELDILSNNWVWWRMTWKVFMRRKIGHIISYYLGRPSDRMYNFLSQQFTTVTLRVEMVYDDYITRLSPDRP